MFVVYRVVNNCPFFTKRTVIQNIVALETNSERIETREIHNTVDGKAQDARPP